MTGAPLLEVRELLVQRRGKTVLAVDHLAIENGEVLALIGPNGAGKSTLLLALSQLIRSQAGQFTFKGAPLSFRNAHPFRQHIALVLQEPLLLDVSVEENVAAGLKFRHTPPAEIAQRVTPWMERLGIAHLRGRSARQLSGGESQRVSLARALVLEPQLLLLDEPFSALDAPTRARLLDDFQAILAETRLTTIFVTHDQNEALMLGDRVGVLLGGSLQQLDTPQDVFSRPASPDVAAFVGVETILPGQVKQSQAGLMQIRVNNARIEAAGDLQEGRSVLVMLRPENITLWRTGDLPPSSARNLLAGHVTRLLPQGALVRVSLDCGFPLVALVTHSSAEQLGLAPGQPIVASFKASAVHVIPRH